MNRKRQVTSNKEYEKRVEKKHKFRYRYLVIFILAVLIITFIIYMLQTSVNDIIWLLNYLLFSWEFYIKKYLFRHSWLVESGVFFYLIFLFDQLTKKYFHNKIFFNKKIILTK